MVHYAQVVTVDKGRKWMCVVMHERLFISPSTDGSTESQRRKHSPILVLSLEPSDLHLLSSTVF